MVLVVEETHDYFRVEIDAGELQRALDAFTGDLGVEATSDLGIGLEEQAELFRKFVSDVLQWIRIRYDEPDRLEHMWRTLVHRTSERPNSLKEVQTSFSSRRVYFWGCEIGRLVRLGSLRFRFDSEDDRETSPGESYGDSDASQPYPDGR